MPKTKNRKYERVRHLSNVIIPGPESPPGPYPWNTPPFVAMGKILELGCGKGEHSLAFAQARPDRVCIGVDRKSYRLCEGGENGLALGLENLFFLRTEIKDIHDFFEDHSISEIWLTFPDPHPKQREIKHRLTSSRFMAAYARLLVPGGRVHLKTDSDLMYAYTRDGVAYWGGRIVDDVQDLQPATGTGAGAGQVVSTFEAKARSRGETIKYLEFTLN